MPTIAESRSTSCSGAGSPSPTSAPGSQSPSMARGDANPRAGIARRRGIRPEDAVRSEVGADDVDAVKPGLVGGLVLRLRRRTCLREFPIAAFDAAAGESTGNDEFMKGRHATICSGRGLIASAFLSGYNLIK